MKNVIIGIVAALSVVIGFIAYWVLSRKYPQPIKSNLEGEAKMTPKCCKACECCKVKTLAPGALAIMDEQKRSTDEVTIKGRLVDLRCYSMDLRNVHQDHITWDDMPMKKCATFCAMNGIPVGLLEHDRLGGKVYVLLAPSIGLAKHMDKIAKVTGRIMKDSGGFLPTVPVQIQTDSGSFEEVDLCTPM